MQNANIPTITATMKGPLKRKKYCKGQSVVTGPGPALIVLRFPQLLLDALTSLIDILMHVVADLRHCVVHTGQRVIHSLLGSVTNLVEVIWK